jgi:hypothetical protein
VIDLQLLRRRFTNNLPAILSGEATLKNRTGGDSGYGYIQSLIQAIEDFTGDAEAKDPAAFQHRGANLKYAVQRHLYFSFVNNERLYTVFTQWWRNELPPVLKLVTALERDLALYLCRMDITPARALVRPPRSVRALRLLSHFHRSTRHLTLYPFARARAVSLRREEKATVLIHVMQEKFVRHLRPVTDRLPLSFAYLVAANHAVKAFLEKQRLPLIDTTHLFKLSVGQASQAVMANFRYLTHLYDHLYATLGRLSPRCVVLVEGNAAEDEIANRVCQQLSIPVVCLQQGWSPVVHNGFRNMSYSKMLVWGEGFAELLQPYNPDQKFVGVGNHLSHSTVADAGLTRTEDQKAIAFFLQAPGRLITRAFWCQFLDLVKWVASEFKHVPILVREHPGYPLARWTRAKLREFPNIRLVPPSDYGLGEILNASCLTVSIYSSTILESIAAGVLPVIFNRTSLPTYFPAVHSAGAGIEVKTFELASQVIRRLVTDKAYARQFEPGMKQFRDKYFCQGGWVAVDRIVSEIASFA